MYHIYICYLVHTFDHQQGMVGLAPKWVRLDPNRTNPGLFQIRFQCIWLIESDVDAMV